VTAPTSAEYAAADNITAGMGRDPKTEAELRERVAQVLADVQGKYELVASELLYLGGGIAMVEHEQVDLAAAAFTDAAQRIRAVK